MVNFNNDIGKCAHLCGLVGGHCSDCETQVDYPTSIPTAAAVRSFATGATRSADNGRYDPEGFLHPAVIERFCEYMQKHRVQADGTLRDSDNWQKGMPLAAYVKGLWRHFLHLWSRHRGCEPNDTKAAESAVDDCCAIMFNAMGYMYQSLKATGRIP